jgi:hypothetical protein
MQVTNPWIEYNRCIAASRKRRWIHNRTHLTIYPSSTHVRALEKFLLHFVPVSSHWLSLVSGVYIASVPDMGVQWLKLALSKGPNRVGVSLHLRTETDPVEWLRLALSKGPNRVGVSLHLRTETDPVSERSCFSSNYFESGRWTKSENPVIMCVIHHRQNPIESTYLTMTEIS